MADAQPLKPANILNIVAINQGKKPETTGTPKAKPLSVEKVAAMQQEGHVIVDCRESAVFGGGHLHGSLNVQLSGKEFEQRVGWMIPDNAPMILVTDSGADAQKAIYKMAFIGLDSQVVGYLDGGVKAWMAAGKRLQTVGQMDVHTLNHKLATNGLQVLDVRDEEEWDDGHIQVAHHLPYRYMVPQLTHPAQIDKLTIPTEKSVAVVCATGQRSSTAISVLLQNGYQTLYNVTGGMAAWEDAGFEMINAEGLAC